MILDTYIYMYIDDILKIVIASSVSRSISTEMLMPEVELGSQSPVSSYEEGFEELSIVMRTIYLYMFSIIRWFKVIEELILIPEI